MGSDVNDNAVSVKVKAAKLVYLLPRHERRKANLSF
jgi:hypothetical protein